MGKNNLRTFRSSLKPVWVLNFMNIFKCVFFLCSFLFIASCGNENTTINNELSSIENSLDSIPEETSNEVHSVALEEPAGWQLGEYFASDENTYSFCPDGKLFFDNSVNLELTGTWNLKNDTLYLMYTNKIESIGIGEPLPPPPAIPGNYVDQYKEYKTTETAIKSTEYLIWSEIKEFLNQDSSYPYAIIKRGYQCK